MTAQHDPKGLIAESYRIDGIRVEECRSIFFDWALTLPEGVAAPEAVAALLELHGSAAPDHPMTEVLREGLGTVPPPRRRGGRSGRGV